MKKVHNTSEKHISIIGAGRLGFAMAKEYIDQGYNVNILTKMKNPVEIYKKRIENEGGMSILSQEDYGKIKFINDIDALIPSAQNIIDVSSSENTKIITKKIMDAYDINKISHKINYLSVTPDNGNEVKNIFDAWRNKTGKFTQKENQRKFNILITGNINTLKDNLFNEETIKKMNDKETMVIAITDFHRNDKEVFMKTIIDFLVRSNIVTKDEIIKAYEKLNEKVTNFDKSKEMPLMSQEISLDNGKKIIIASHRGMSSSELHQANKVITAFTVDMFDKDGKQIFAQSWHAENVGHFVDGIKRVASSLFFTPSPRL
ncbi:Rossmann-fold NAD(P)-binding domain-containing protein [Candidatus Deianiraea vastatrix]|uniref:Uncharacterized protein n=1 Tax=Candidatus Deianiraea vastatrix TaxID=2163644 RepID=A0A5B8XEZ7_9RICK|nr:SDR family oxidoreductase [Candidatus Deianiraea vastatrix]QED23475.1 hypothetical protein Deia_00683 [Candidatus Deianiraea vastatrix]